MKSALEYLIGERIVDLSTGISSVYPLDNTTGDPVYTSMMVYTRIDFKNYNLSIFNNHEIIGPNNNSPINMTGEKVISVEENENEAIILLEKNDVIKIDLRDSAYNDPEAMCLYGPNNLCVVWN
ncbi:MAG TPA: hypothetical protein VK772_11760 [Puia sp.]|jgi:hypothetical protein|nr:hypothetical protein [Puia sp.]